MDPKPIPIALDFQRPLLRLREAAHDQSTASLHSWYRRIWPITQVFVGVFVLV
jgi:hypothetical protein